MVDALLNELKLENTDWTAAAEGYIDYPTLAETQHAVE